LHNDDVLYGVQALQKYVEQAPEDAAATYMLAQLLVQQNQLDIAEKYIDILIEFRPDDPIVNQLKAVVLLDRAEYVAAREKALDAISTLPEDAVSRLVAGIASFYLEDYKDTVAHLSVVAPKLPAQHPGLRFLAVSLLNVNDSAEANNVLQRIDQPESNDAPIYFRTASALQQAGDSESAKAILNQASQLQETSEQLALIGMTKLSLDDLSGLEDLEIASDQLPESVNISKTLAQAYITLEMYDKAQELAQQLKSNPETVITAYLIEAEILRLTEKFSDAMTILAQAKNLDANNKEVKYAEIKLAFEVNDIDLSARATEDLLSLDAGDLQGLSFLFYIERAKGSVQAAYDRALTVFTQQPDNSALAMLIATNHLLDKAPEAALDMILNIPSDQMAPINFWPLKAKALLDAGRQDEAESHYNQWAELYPFSDGAVLGQLLILDRKQNYEEGVRRASEFLRLKNEPSVVVLQAHFASLLGDASAAKKSLSSIDESLLSDPFTQSIVARVELIENKPKSALPRAKIAYEHNPHPNNLFLYVHALDAMRQLDTSYEVLINHANRFDRDIPARILLGERQMRRDPNAAIANYQGLLSLIPNNWVVLNNLAFMQKQQGDLESALANAEKAYTVEQSNVAVVDTYAQVLIELARYEEAVNAYTRVISNQISNQEVHVHYIEALLRSGDTLRAERHLQRHTFDQPLALSKLNSLKQEFGLRI
jgi:putative PEP-CTERM system TPR-repeat lipoprotein